MDTQSSSYSAATQRQTSLSAPTVRIIAKIAREFSAEAAGKKLGDSRGRHVGHPKRLVPVPIITAGGESRNV